MNMNPRKRNALWFAVKKIARDLWAISDHGWDTCYLVCGTKRAILIDSTWGVGKLKECVDRLTRLPVEVVQTHGHSDHVCGSHEFGRVHIARPDIPLLKSSYTKEARVGIARNFKKVLAKNGISSEAIAAARLQKIMPVSDGRIFDLGKRKLKTIAIPGHTGGCIALFEENEGWLFTGDSVLCGTVILDSPASKPVAVYRNSLKKLESLGKAVKQVLPGHNTTPLSRSIIHLLGKGAQAVLNGNKKAVKMKNGHWGVNLGRVWLIVPAISSR
jgi:hydroxyacylglutathione hydrolase